MTTQAKTLYPAGFVETEDCDGPRLVRSQPSRESEGVTLSQCEEKYGPVSRFPEQQKEKLGSPEIIRIENFVDQDLASFLNANFKENTDKQVAELLDTLTGVRINKSLDPKFQEQLKDAVTKWKNSQSIMYYSTYQTGVFLFLMILLFFLIGLAIPT